MFKTKTQRRIDQLERKVDDLTYSINRLKEQVEIRTLHENLHTYTNYPSEVIPIILDKLNIQLKYTTPIKSKLSYKDIR